jgi:lambda family phage portal protein
VNPLDRAIAAVSPGWAARRLHSRARINAMNAAYEAADITRLRRRAHDFGSGNNAVGGSAYSIRNQARHLGRNHDIVVGGLNTLVQNVIGPTGIGVEPQPRDENGDIVESIAEQLSRLWAEWCKHPEVSRSHDYGSMQRLKALTLFRDGEVLQQDLIGPVAGLEHASAVPYSIELIEPDLLPLDFSDASRNILQGVECNIWGRALAYWLYKQHPGDPLFNFNGNFSAGFIPDLKRVSSDLIRHTKLIDRIGQRRGMSILAAVLTRLEDLKDYEESERIAAKIAACMAAYIIKGSPQDYSGTDARGAPFPKRNMRFEPGMVFDDLLLGESVGTIDTKRPNGNLEPHRNGQLRAVASGMRVSFSSLSKNYQGSYSSQRQELVEQYGAYGVLAYEYISQDARPTWERFVSVTLLSGELVVPRGMSLRGIYDALFIPPQMPWIDPLKEAESLALLEDHAFMSGSEAVRRRGADPRSVLQQVAAWIKRKAQLGIPPPSNRDGFKLGTDPGAAAADPSTATSTANTSDGENA